MSILISKAAKDKLHQHFQLGDKRFLRLQVVSGGCAGMTYEALVDDNLREEDELIHQEGEIRIFCDKRSSLFITGLIIDYSTDLIQAGFRLSNPEAKSSCGCGASFNA